jgi:hypothetical protein
MCLLNTPYLNRKARFVYAAANLCLAMGVALPQFGLRLGLHHQVLLDGLHGLFLGFSITLFLWVMRLKRSSAPPMAGNP